MLVDKACLKLIHILAVAFFIGLENKRDEFITGADFPQKANPSQRVYSAVMGKTGIGNNPKRIVRIFIIKSDGLLIIAGKNNLGPPAHAQGTLMGVKGLGSKLHTLLEHEFIKIRQDG